MDVGQGNMNSSWIAMLFNNNKNVFSQEATSPSGCFQAGPENQNTRKN